LKQIKFWLNEEQYERLKREAEKQGVSPYALIKQRVLKYRKVALASYLLLVYAAISTGIILYLITMIPVLS